MYNIKDENLKAYQKLKGIIDNTTLDIEDIPASFDTELVQRRFKISSLEMIIKDMKAKYKVDVLNNKY